MVAHASGQRKRKLYYLGEGLESIRGTFFRQVMFAEFELAIHQEIEEGRTLSGARLTEMYCGLLKKYYGDAEGVMHIDPAYCIEWAFVPAFLLQFLRLPVRDIDGRGGASSPPRLKRKVNRRRIVSSPCCGPAVRIIPMNYTGGRHRYGGPGALSRADRAHEPDHGRHRRPDCLTSLNGEGQRDCHNDRLLAGRRSALQRLRMRVAPPNGPGPDHARSFLRWT